MINSYSFQLVDYKYAILLSKQLATLIASSTCEYYCISMFPYPSGVLHLGHFRNYLINDIICRYVSLTGCCKSVMYFGWDAFGLPAENASIIYGYNPLQWTLINIAIMKQQLAVFHFLIDWHYEINTASLFFYRWSQFFFSLLYRKGYIYKRSYIVNWDPVDQTVLANEQVLNGYGWRSGAKVQKRHLESYYIRVRPVVTEILTRLTALNWPTTVINSQFNWIGRRLYYTCLFIVDGTYVSVYFTNPLLLFTEFVIYTSFEYYMSFFRDFSCDYSDSASYITKRVFKCSFLGGKRVLLHLVSATSVAFDGFFIRQCSTLVWCSARFYNSRPFRVLLFRVLLASKRVFRVFKFKMRDWCISRQRYWGTPIPLYYCYYCSKSYLTYEPVILPYYIGKVTYTYFSNDSRFLLLQCYFCGLWAFRSVETLDTFFDSSWYFLYYLLKPTFSVASLRALSMPIDVYIGGKEHSILHLLYVRVFFALLNRVGFLRFNEPICSLITQGLLLIKNSDGVYVKMSKSLTSVIDPAALVAIYGNDCLRMYMVFFTAITSDIKWDVSRIAGCYRFINRLWNFFFTHVCTLYYCSFIIYIVFESYFSQVVAYYKHNKFNLALATLMKFFNLLVTAVSKQLISTHCLFTYYSKLIFYLHPICPGFTSILWHISGNSKYFGDIYNYKFNVLSTDSW
ncbi:class I tRNA ligase family protein [Candidatus Vidania fulgoroideae]|nr:class I tRNA ligase family protein [Candidatus Vidania fulgoroideae]